MQRSVATFCFLVALVIIALPTAAPAGTYKDLCADRWSSDYSMRKRCLQRQANATRVIERFVGRHDLRRKARAVANGRAPSGPYLKMFRLCGMRWQVPKYDTMDFAMVARCLAKQEKAYKSLRK